MPTKTVSIQMPDSFPAALKTHPQDMPDFIKKTLAVELYREGVLSLGKAAELAGVSNKWEMLTILSERKVPLPYTAEDTAEDLKTLKEVIR